MQRYNEKRDWNSPEYKNLRKMARKRDKYKCRWPNCKGRAENVHHVYPWKKYPSLRFILSNVICLCKMHHNSIKDKEHCYIEMFKTILEIEKRKK